MMEATMFLLKLDELPAEEIESQLEIVEAFTRGFRLARDRFEKDD